MSSFPKIDKGIPRLIMQRLSQSQFLAGHVEALTDVGNTVTCIRVMRGRIKFDDIFHHMVRD